MEETRTISDLPLRPVGHGETQVQVFRSAAERGAAEDEGEGDASPGPRSPPPRLGRSTIPSLQRRLFEADGRPVRLGRYDVIRCVGAGGMGVVYEAVDVDHGHRVALKTLRWMTGAGLSRFKNEFRSLAGVSHPNLVGLYELGAEADEWFFTMELVEGESFVEHVQSDAARPLGGWEYLGETLAEVSLSGVDLGELGVAGGRVLGFHEGRLRAALRQLAAAVAALHDLGKLHRDLNPGNVLVTREGRVVVLDFGLICDRERHADAPYDGACGTPAYMSPEQAAGKPATPASDWYGVGVMLFEALTGQLPFTGSAVRMLGNKRHQDAPPPSLLAPGLPAELEALCVALLRRKPEARPDAAAVLRSLGVSPRRSGEVWVSRDDGLFAGRRAELAALDEAQRAAETAGPVALVVHGPPGIGKTRLLSRFLGAAAQRGALVLRGACRERESIPHPMLDALVDALASHLGALPEAEVRAALPEGMRCLAGIFPVLEAIPAVVELPPRRDPEGDPGRLEDAAFACLREVLARLAGARPLVLCVDDAHLGDAQGARRLAALVAPAGPPALFLLLAHESESLGSSPVLAELSRSLRDVRRVALGPLAADEAQEVARRALPTEHPDLDAVAAAIAAASEGSPVAVEGLAVHVADGGEKVSLDEAIGARLARLAEHALRLVEVAAAAGGPIERSLLVAVAVAEGTLGSSGAAALGSLTAMRFLRATAGADRVCIHDERTRAVVAAGTPPAVARQIHLGLGHALAARPGADPGAAAACFERAGAAELCALHLGRAAEQAMSGRDFPRAADLWARALAFTRGGSAEARARGARRAEALAAAGRVAEAAEAYLEGALGAPRAEALDRRRRAAEHLLVGGHVDQGLAALRAALEAQGVRWPETPRRALLIVAGRLLELRLRGARLPDAAAAGARLPERARVEVLWSAGRGLSTIDPLRSAAFMVEALLAALAAGDAEHASRALALTGSMLVSLGGAADEARGLDLIDEAARFARRSGDPSLLGFSWFCSGLARLSAGRFREALARVDEGLALLEEHREGLAWERTTHRAICLQALFELGALRERARRAEGWLREARAAGDRTGEAQAGTAAAFGVLAGGDPAGARAALREAMGCSSHGGLGLPHHAALGVEVSSLLYQGDADAARARLVAAWPALAASQLLRIQLVRVEALTLRGLTAVAMGRADLHRHVEIDAAQLAREKRPHARAAAALLRAGVARGRGEIARAADGLDQAARGYASAEMLVHAAAARRARGALLGGAEGRALIAAADAVLTAEGVVDGARWAAMYTGFAR
jgi:eukaryotic-like serine/threonine-protein kinase